MASLSMLKKQKLAKQMNGNDDWVFKFPCPFLVFHWWVKYITQKDEWVLNIAGFCILKSYSISFFLPSLLNYSSTIHSFSIYAVPINQEPFFSLYIFVKPIHHYIFLGFFFSSSEENFLFRSAVIYIFVFLFFFSQIQNLYHYLVSIDSRKKGQLFSFFNLLLSLAKCWLQDYLGNSSV